MTAVNRILGRMFEVLFVPLRGLPPLASLALIALAVAIGMLLLYRGTSNQARIAAAKRRIQAGLYEIRLFNDDPIAILRSQKDILLHNLHYVRLSLVPTLWMILPLTVLVAQMQTYYGYVPLRAGEPFLVEVQLRPAPAAAAQGAGRPVAELRLPAGLHAETSEAWLPAVSQLVWRLRAERAGRYEIEIHAGGAALAKNVRVEAGLWRLSPVRRAASLATHLLFPAEAPLPSDGPIESIRVTYEKREIPVLGWQLPWLVVFIGLVMLFALLFRRRLRVVL